MSDGISRMAIDSETGVLIQSVTQEAIENPRNSYQLELKYSLKRMSYGVGADAAR